MDFPAWVLGGSKVPEMCREQDASSSEGQEQEARGTECDSQGKPG